MIIGHKTITEAMGFTINCRSVGEHSKRRRSYAVRLSGDFGKANVGISNDKYSEKLYRRKTKDS